ncbi:uncharacterized protein LOC111390606, partial [Olea europaea var. sylvestris]|uniref:uncharacterized protein LOC111390606 n=1 Tax=Olea europaea var. sylvestris TaxID=158386 RepID=UPI000C1D7CA6
MFTKKRKLPEFETVALTEESSARVQRKLPPKLKDPGSFTLPVSIGNSYSAKALCDTGTSINLMLYSAYRKLGLGEVNSTSITLQLADGTRPRGKVEDGSLEIIVDFVCVNFCVDYPNEDNFKNLIVNRLFIAFMTPVIKL